MPITSTLYLSSESTINPPTNKTNLANVSWLINWDEIFRGKTGLCKLTVNLISKKNTVLEDTWDSKVGMLYANFTSPFTLMSGNGFPITPINRNQYIEIVTDEQGVTSTAYVSYFQANNSQVSSSPVISIPEGRIPFTLSFQTTTGALMTNIPEYNIFLSFEWLSDEERKKYFI